MKPLFLPNLNRKIWKWPPQGTSTCPVACTTVRGHSAKSAEAVGPRTYLQGPRLIIDPRGGICKLRGAHLGRQQKLRKNCALFFLGL